MSPRQERLTSRLRLRPIGAEDAPVLLDLHRDPGIAEWYGGPWSSEEAHERAGSMGDQWDHDGIGKWLAFDRERGDVVGRGGLSWVYILGLRRLEVGWAVRQALWGRGLATEIGAEALVLAFEELGADEVIAFTEAHNGRSRRVMERLGMRFRQEIFRPGLLPRGQAVHPDARFALYAIGPSSTRM